MSRVYQGGGTGYVAVPEAGVAVGSTEAAKNGGMLGPSGVVFFDAPAITKAKSGKVFVVASISGTASGAGDDVLVDLRMDGVAFGPAGSVFTQAGGAGSHQTWQGTLAWVFTLTDEATHTFGITAVDGSGGALSVPPGGASVAVVES